MMYRAKMPRHGARVVCLVEVLVGEANRKCLDLVRAQTRHHRNHNGGVYSSTEQCSQRHITGQATTNGAGKTVLKFVEALAFRFGLVDPVLGQIPVLAYSYSAPGQL